MKAILRAATRSPHPCYQIDTQALPEAPTKQSASSLVPGGVMAMPVVQLVDGQTIVLQMQPPLDGVWSFHVIPRWEDRCRLLVRTRLFSRRFW